MSIHTVSVVGYPCLERTNENFELSFATILLVSSDGLGLWDEICIPFQIKWWQEDPSRAFILLAYYSFPLYATLMISRQNACQVGNRAIYTQVVMDEIIFWPRTANCDGLRRVPCSSKAKKQSWIHILLNLHDDVTWTTNGSAICLVYAIVNGWDDACASYSQLCLKYFAVGGRQD
jgi:hypothetical protein